MISSLSHTLAQCAVAVLTVAILAACQPGHNASSQDESRADSLIDDAVKSRQLDRVLVLCDSLEALHEISPIGAGLWRGWSHHKMKKYQQAEDYYRQALQATPHTAADAENQQLAAGYLADLLYIVHDYEGALRVAVPVVNRLEEQGNGTNDAIIMLLSSVGRCQMKLGRLDEASATFESAYQHNLEAIAADTTDSKLRNAIIHTGNVAIRYLNVKLFDQAEPWLGRTEELLDRYAQRPDAMQHFVSEYRARLHIYHAYSLEELGRHDEAAEAYRHYQASDYFQTDDGRSDACEYLIAAHRYAEAADILADLDRMMEQWGYQPTLDNIQSYLLPKYRACKGAGRPDSANAVASQICEALDSAIAWQKNSDAAELATIYDTQQKEMTITQQKADLSRQQMTATAIAFALIMVFMVIYLLYRRRVHRQLQEAYDQLEQTTTAKERIESELRIARNIQMSMVPSVFPQREGLDLYASMTPAREVGGDLYGYLLDGHRLYFCVGDASGKGVPASLFMAQTIRLFRTLAAQGMQPAEILTRMNNALAEDNEQGMFVTMFLGLVDLQSGRLLFCNAGHNPPVIGGGQHHGDFLSVKSNAPIGLWPGICFEGEEIESIKGKPLFIYTDGLNEAENASLEQFGEDRMLTILRALNFENSRQVIEQLVKAVDTHRGGAEPNDDLTLMCLKVEA